MKSIPLTQGKFALVDDEDYNALIAFHWHFGGRHGYALRKIRQNGKQAIVWMHRVIACTPIGSFTDHINGNKLDNRRENLRVASSSQNRQNQRKFKSQFKGIWKEKGKWRAAVKPPGKPRIRMGPFNSPADAALAYDEKALMVFGDFAATNFGRARK